MNNISIPLRKRIKVYRRALEIIDNEEDVYGLDKDYVLCVLLRCVEMNLRHYLNGDWSFSKTPILYPEFGKYYYWSRPTRFEKTYDENPLLWRRVVLKLIIEEYDRKQLLRKKKQRWNKQINKNPKLKNK